MYSVHESDLQRDEVAIIEVFVKNVYTHICRIKGCGGAGWPPHQ